MKELKNRNIVKQIIGSRPIMTALLAALALLLASCSNGINGTDSGGSSADGKTYISISAKTASSRSLAPSADDYSTEKLTDLVLSGKTVGEGADTATDTEAVTLAQTESLAELSGKSIPIEAGNWLFTLSATLNGVSYYGETRAEIEKGKINPISFTLTPETSYGGMSITVEFTGEADKVSVSLKKAGNEELLADSELTPVQGTDGKKSVTFSRSATNEEEKLESGSYYLLFEFFGPDGVGCLNTVENIVRVQEGITTSAKLTLDLNEIYTISYETNGGEPASTNTVLTNRYSRKSGEITLPKMKKAGYAFAGWYESADFTGSPVTEIAKDSAGNKTLYAAYANSVTVSPSGNNLTCNGLSESALSIDYAVSLINGWNDSSVDYTIYIDGELTYAQTIADSVEGGTLTKIKAASITLEGKTGSSTDKINAGWDGNTDNIPDSENNIGTALSIKTSVPVTIKNLTVTGGCAASGNEGNDLGGGIRLGGVYSDGDTEKPFEASLTLAGGAVVTKNYANGYGGGVYVSFGSNLTIETGAEISGNTGYGGGVCIYPCGTDSIEGTFETTVTMKGGSISGNTGCANTDGSFGGGGVLVYDYSGSASFVMNGGSISENTCDGYGGGVCIYGGNVKFTMNGGTIGGSTSDNGNSSTTYNGYGGGVYIRGGSTFEMIDGAISCNKSEATDGGGGGAVFISSGTFDMKGGSLTGNTATYQGGGVYIASEGIFNMTGGSISGNKATDGTGGGGVYNKGTFTMSGGSIAGNKATSGTGGGVYNAGTLFMYGSAVIGDASATTAATADTYSNYASGGGAGLYNASGAEAYLGYSDASTKAALTGGICYNYKGDGAGINNQGTVKMASGSVSYNGHDGYAVGVLNNATFELSGGKVCGNAYSGSGSCYGGGFRNEDGTLTMTGGEISGNSSTYGGGVMVRSGTFKMTGGSITGNSATTGKSIYNEEGTVSVTDITVNANSGYDQDISL